LLFCTYILAKDNISIAMHAVHNNFCQDCSLESNADFDVNKYYKQRLIMTLYGNAALLLFYSFVIGI
jgi:hypothetical protein